MRISSYMFHQLGVDAMLNQQSDLSRTQMQISSGRRVLTPADDPVAAEQSLELGQSLARTDQFNKNADQATLQLQVEEGVLTSFGDNLQRIRQLALQASNDSQSQESRHYIATEMRQLLSDMLDLANSTDGNGNYIFAGSKATTKPFAQIASNPITQVVGTPPPPNASTPNPSAFYYSGDQGQRFLQISEDRQVAINDPGSQVFNFIRNGNGTFTTSADPANLTRVPGGTGIIGPGDVLDPAFKSNPTSFTINFTQALDASGTMQTYYSVSNAGAVVVPTTLYTPDTDILIPAAAGGTPVIKVPMKGSPAAGDQFHIAPATNQSIFDTVNNMIAEIEAAGTTQSERIEFHNKLDNELASLDEGMTNILDTRAKIGGRMNAISTQKDMGDASSLQFQTMISDMTDLDYTEALSRFQRQMTGLQASQQAYAKVTSLSLFNYI